jgi:hypothetical protein
VVLAATAVVSSPILWLVHEGSLSVEDGVLRWFVCLVVCRIAISVVASVAYPSPPATHQATVTTEPAGGGEPSPTGAEQVST